MTGRLNIHVYQKFLTETATTNSEYIVVQRNPVIVKGPYSDLQSAKDELKEIAKNGGSRMMLEIIDGVLQVDPHRINGISQTPANGFEKFWYDWWDINAMVEIVKQHMGKKKEYCVDIREMVSH